MQPFFFWVNQYQTSSELRLPLSAWGFWFTISCAIKKTSLIWVLSYMVGNTRSDTSRPGCCAFTWQARRCLSSGA
eukprot:7753242-Heterocapsa_arctica.AAC.1